MWVLVWCQGVDIDPLGCAHFDAIKFDALWVMVDTFR